MSQMNKPTIPGADRLARLPRRSDLILEGGKRAAGIYVREGGQTIGLELALWVDAESGIVRAVSEPISPLESVDGGLTQALTALVVALAGPFPMLPVGGELELVPTTGRGKADQEARRSLAEPALPGLVRVNDEALAAAARDMLAPVGVPVEFVADLPTWEEAFGFMASGLGGDPAAGPPEPFAWEIDVALARPLFKAAAGYARRAPWEYVPGDPPLALTLGTYGPRDGAETLYASILGAGGEVMGVAFYLSLNDYRQAVQRGGEISEDDETIYAAIEELRRLGAPVDDLDPDVLFHTVAKMVAEQEPEIGERRQIAEESLVLFYTDEEETEPTYVEWVRERGLTFVKSRGIPSFLRTGAGQEPRPPDEREVIAMTVAIEALNALFSKRADQMALTAAEQPHAALTYVAQAPLRGTTVAVQVSYPPDGYIMAALPILDGDESDEGDPTA